MNLYPRKCSIIDNSGGSVINCFKVLGKGVSMPLEVGDIVVGAVVRLKSSQKIKRVKKGDLVKGLVVMSTKPFCRIDGTIEKYSDTLIVLLNNQNNLIGSRILCPISIQLKDTSFSRFLSLSPSIL